MLMELQSIRFAYPDPAGQRKRLGLRAQAVDGVSMTIQAGEKLALLGANGSGKTTLLSLLNGLLRPSSGAVFWQGSALEYGKKALRDLRQQVATVFQNPEDQLFAGTLYEDVSFGPLNLGLGESEVRSRVQDALLAVELDRQADLPLHMLSFGQKKRAALAGALAMRPRMLILDEPTAGLDPHSEMRLLQILDTRVQQGTSVVFSTHDVDLAWEWSHRAALLSEGRLQGLGKTQALLSDAPLMKRCALRLPRGISVLSAPRIRKAVQAPVQTGTPSRLLVFTGEGKGKTTASLGLALRAAGHGFGVAICQFIKSRRQVGEVLGCNDQPNIRFFVGGQGFVPPPESPQFPRHCQSAQRGWRWARTALHSSAYRVVILDEICVALHHGLLSNTEVLAELRLLPPGKIVVCTGRYASPDLLNLADTATEMRKLKHALDQGIPATLGVEK
ncbi:MAG TPA: cob(I)yrinic acid a,c-diamide adenosyltransferase [Fibrobacteraceae bacterium]|nr:cob(I)yrinic acid a,c-diamide adenosyltransferase [Fibrobacteraceae bacterium]